MSWSPDPDLVAAHQAVMEGEHYPVLDRAIAAGAYLLLGQVIPEGLRGNLASAVREALDRYEWVALDRSAEALRRWARDLPTMEPEQVAEVEEDVVEAFSVRDEVELLRAARGALASEAGPHVDAWAARWADVVQPVLYCFLPLGTRRAARVAWMAPEYRKRFWWWWQGHDLPPAVLDHLATVAHLLRVFPEAVGYLERLVQSDRMLEKLTCGS